PGHGLPAQPHRRRHQCVIGQRRRGRRRAGPGRRQYPGGDDRAHRPAHHLPLSLPSALLRLGRDARFGEGLIHLYPRMRPTAVVDVRGPRRPHSERPLPAAIDRVLGPPPERPTSWLSSDAPSSADSQPDWSPAGWQPAAAETTTGATPAETEAVNLSSSTTSGSQPWTTTRRA